MLFIAGGPMKTGSTYLYQVMTEIVLLHGGRCPKPYEINEQLVQTWAGEPNGVVIKLHEFHAALKLDHGILSLVSIRDPRDVFVSLMNFQANTFEGTMASRAVQNWGVSLRSWDESPFPVAYVAYEKMISEPVESVSCIADEMGYILHPEMAKYIARKWSREANRKRARELKVDQNSRHFMSPRHIKSGDLRQYKQALTDEQLAQVEEFFADEIEQFGY